jgi:type I restriction enzyme S subunit
VKSGELFSFVTSGSRGWAKYYSDKGAIFIRITNQL